MTTQSGQVCDASGLPPDQQYWNAALFFLFPVLILIAFGVLVATVGISWMWSITPFDLVLISLATFRLIRMVVYDKIFSFARNYVFDCNNDEYVKPVGGFKRAVAELIECLWCMGVWAALAATTLYYIAPIGRFFVLVLAIAALGSFMQVVSKAVGNMHSH